MNSVMPEIGKPVKAAVVVPVIAPPAVNAKLAGALDPVVIVTAAPLVTEQKPPMQGIPLNN